MSLIVSTVSNSVEVHNFTKSHTETKAKEQNFRDLIGSPKPDNYQYDASHNGIKIELKFDGRMNKTGNLFLEEYSSYDPKKPGGVLRAALDGIPIFIYINDVTKIAYVFDSIELAGWQQKNFEGLPQGQARNKSDNGTAYITYGRLAKLDRIQNLLLGSFHLEDPTAVQRMLKVIEAYTN